MTKLLQLELNEVNFDYVAAYGRQGKLPYLNALIARHGLTQTVSERDYDNLEPWIQWVTAHSGKTFAEHGVFRLGDICGRDDVVQIWETLEAQGVSVGAISPMNAANRCTAPAFFVPDPWTQTRLVGSDLVARLYEAIARLVGDNAQAAMTPAALLAIAQGLLRYGRASNYLEYCSSAVRGLTKSWSRAIVLDLLLSDLFIVEAARTRVAYATLFLNAAAHIQHHYLFNASVAQGAGRNPDWYLGRQHDPVYEVYALYDRIVRDVARRFPEHRLLIATGLHQEPYPTSLFYWRLADHSAFLDRIGVEYARVEPRMSRDFVVYCASSAQALAAEQRLGHVSASDGQPLFEVDNRGNSLFVTLNFPTAIAADLTYRIGERVLGHLLDAVAFVAIKNGEHNGIGYLIDTAQVRGTHPAQIPLRALFDITRAHFEPSAAVAA